MSRRRLLVVLALLVPLGLLTKATDQELIRGYAGGVLYVMFFTFAVLLARPEWRPERVAAGVLLATCALEVLQLWHPQWLERVRATFLGQTLLGSTFSGWDFAAYALGAAAAIVLARALRA